MGKPLAAGDRLLTLAEKLRFIAEASYQIEPLLHVMERLAEEESDHLRFFCIAVAPRLRDLNQASMSATCDECFQSELMGYDVPVPGAGGACNG